MREVYFVQGQTTGLIKIGFAEDSSARLRHLQVCSPDRLTLLGIVLCRNHGRLEAELHARFHHLLEHGEWHRPGEDLLAYIREHARSGGQAWEGDLRAALEATYG